MSIAHYTVPIPDSATICADWPSLYEEVRIHWGHTCLEKDYGGYIIRDQDHIVLVCTDDLCKILEQKDQEAQTITFHEPGSGVPISNYTVGLPSSAKVCSTWPSLRAAVLQRPGAKVLQKYGGFVIEEDGVLVIACDEQMSVAAAAHPEQLEYIYDDVAEQARSQ